MEVSVLVPWRSQDPQRIRVWEYVRSEWDRAGVQVCVGVDAESGPFNTARACNDAFNRSTKPYVLTTGADCIPDPHAVYRALEVLKTTDRRWIAPFDKTEYYDSTTTNRILQHRQWWEEKTNAQYSVPFQTGIMLITREAYLETGGHDERFEGWGGEDAAFRRVVHLLHGDSDPLPLTLRCLWHDPGARGTMSERNFELCRIYDTMTSRQQCLDYLSSRERYI